LAVLVSFATSLLAIQGLYERMSWGKVVLGLITVLCAWPSSHFFRNGHFAYSALLLAAPSLGALLVYGGCLWRSAVFREIRECGQRRTWGSVSYFFAFVGTTALTSCTLLWLQSYSRREIINVGGLHELGLFNTSWNFCMQYATLILGTFGTYYLPTLASKQEPEERRRQITQMFRFATIMGGSTVVLVIALKPMVITILTSEAFLCSLHSLRWMLIGDFFKITSWALTMVSMARNDKRHILGIEGVFFLAFATSLFFVKQPGDSEIVAIGFAVGYLLFAVYGFIYVLIVEKLLLPWLVMRSWLSYLAVVLILSTLTWSHATVNWHYAILAAVLLMACALLSLQKNEFLALRSIFLKK
jgi:O-antigen/teichoic acid export membrane protein